MAINSDFRSSGPFSSTFVNTKSFHVLGIFFVSSVNEVLKFSFALCGCLSDTHTHTQKKWLSFRNNWWWRFQHLRIQQILLHRGTAHSSRVIRAVWDRWFQISLSPTPGLPPQCSANGYIIKSARFYRESSSRLNHCSILLFHFFMFSPLFCWYNSFHNKCKAHKIPFYASLGII